MKTKKQILEAVISDKKSSKCIDGRDMSRLAQFFPKEQVQVFGFTAEESYAPVELSEAKVLEELKKDVEFGFYKALNKRGLSAGLMFEAVKTWLWILDDPLYDFDDYRWYGLPLFKAVAEKYGFDNEIGNDTGGESKYSVEIEFDD